MTKIKFRKVLSLVLAFVMCTSLFSNWDFKAFATDGVKSQDLAPVISTTLKGDVTLYNGVEDGASSVDITCEEEINIDLYKKLVVQETGKVFYQFYVTGSVPEELEETFANYIFVGAATVGLPEVETTPEPTVEPTATPEPTVEPTATPEPTVEPTATPEPTPTVEPTDEYLVDTIGEADSIAVYMVDEGYYQIDNSGISIQSADEKMATVTNITVTPVSKALGNIPAGAKDYLIWNNSLFFDITLTDENGNEVILDGEVTAVFSEDLVTSVSKFANLTNNDKVDYYTYRIHEDGSAISSNIKGYKSGTITATHTGLSIVGFAAQASEITDSFVDFSEEIAVVPIGSSIRIYNSGQHHMTDYKTFTIGENERFTVAQKLTLTDGVDQVEVYITALNNAFIGNNSEIDNLVNNTSYYWLRVSDVQKYVEPTVTPTPTPTPDTPDLEDTTLEDTGIVVSGSLPAGTKLDVKELTVEEVEKVLDTSKYPLGENTKAYDIKLMLNGVEYDPAEPVTLDFTSNSIGFDKYTGYMTYHIHNDRVDVIGPTVVSNKGLSLTVEDFSHFIFANLFETACDYVWEGNFIKDTVTVYDSIMPGASSYELNNATTFAVKTSYMYKFYNGDTWYLLRYPVQDEAGNYYAWIKADSIFEIEEENYPIIDEDTGIVISGNLPEGTTAIIETVAGEDISEIIDTSVYPVSEDAVFFDITLYDESGNEIQPESPVEVTFPAYLFEGTEGTFYLGYHIHDGKVDVLGPYEYTGEDIVVIVDNFSYIGFGDGYTYEVIDQPYDAVFTSDTVTLFKDHTSTEISEENSVTIDVTDKDIVEVYMIYNFDDGTVKYALNYNLIEGDENFNADLYDAISDTSTPIKNIVLGGSIKKYVPPVDQVITDPVTGIKVDGLLPADTRLTVIPQTLADISFDTTLYPLGENTKVYDISLSYDSKPYQPENPVTIILPQTALEFAAESGLAIYHVHNGEVQIIGPVFYAGNGMELTVEGFSQLVFSDTFGKSTDGEWSGMLNKDSVTFYSDIFTKTDSVTQSGVYGADVSGNGTYTDTEGNVWLHMRVAIMNGDVAYHWVNIEDVALTKLDDEFIIPGENFTDVATPITASAAIARYTDIMPFAAVPALPSTPDTSDGVVINKEASVNNDGTYTITLSSYVTGSVTPPSTMPSDIILVLDQSGSMVQSRIGTITVDTTSTLFSPGTSSLSSTKVQDALEDYYNRIYYVETVNGQQQKYPVTITPNYEYRYNAVNARTTSATIYNEYSEGTDYFFKDGEVYRPVTIIKNGDVYTYTYVDGTGVTKILSYTGNRPDGLYTRTATTGNPPSYTVSYTKIGSDGTTTLVSQQVNYNTNMPTGFYYATISTGSGDTRFTALKEAVNNFVDEVAEDAKGGNNQYGDDDDIHHTISIIGFASGQSSSYTNTELFVGRTQYRYNQTGNNAPSAHYDEAPQDMATEDGRGNITDSINALDSSGATYPSYGIEMANGIFAKLLADNSERYVKDGKEVRKKVIIVLTDGEPGQNASSYSAAEADRAVGQAYIAKNTHNATVYTIGIFANADARISVSADKQFGQIVAETNGNKMMHYISSNFKNAKDMDEPGRETFQRDSSNPPLLTGASYYLSAGDSESLNNIFSALSAQVGGAAIELGSSTTVKDIVSPQFILPYGADTSKITVTTQDAVYTGNVLGWTTSTLQDFEPTITITDNNVSVSGFDYTANYVAENGRVEGDDSQEGDFHGRRLLITFVVKPGEYFLGGNGVYTNSETTGIFEDPTDPETQVGEFNYPTVDVPLSDITITWDDQNIYRTNAANIYELFKNASVTSRYDSSKTKPLSEVLDGKNNAYVDFVFEIPGLGTYKLDAGTSFFQRNEDGSIKLVDGQPVFVEGAWTPIAGADFEPELSEDTTYTLKWTMTPNSDPKEGTKEVKSKEDTALVKVFYPEVTLHDTTTYYGSTINITDNVDESKDQINWKNGTTYDSSVKMYGTEPMCNGIDFKDLSGNNIAGLEGNGANKKVITPEDIDVDIKSIVFNGVDLAGKTTFIKDEICTTHNCDYTNDENEIVDFRIHVKEVELKISKTVRGVDGFKPAGDKFTFALASTDALNVDLAYTVHRTSDNARVDAGTISIGGTLTLEDGQYALITGMPIGTYRVAEADAAGYTRTVPANVNYIENTLGASKEEGVAAFTNQLLTTSLTISKTVQDAATYADFIDGKEFTFNVTISGINDSVTLKHADGEIANGDQITLAHGESITFTGLPIGVTYTVEEGEHAEFDPITPEDGIATGTLTVAETLVPFINKISVGDLKIVKIVDGVDGFTVPNDTFEFKVTFNSTRSHDYTITKADGNIATGKISSGQTLMLADGDNAIIKNLPVGDYEVAETADNNYTTTSEGATGKILPGEAVATFTNTLKTTSLEVSKAVVAPSNVDVSNETFNFTVNITGAIEGTVLTYKVNNGNPQNVTVDENGNVVISLGDEDKAEFINLPVAAQYTVTEEENGDYTATASGASGMLAVGVVSKAEFTNELKLFDLKIIKDINGTLYNPDDTFVFRVTGPHSIDMEVVIKGESFAIIKDLPIGTYVVEEDTAWSFRYNATNVTQNVTLNADKEVTVINTPKSDNKWLDSSAYAENIFTTITTN